jgi:hemerythrin-like domain-containing protein
MLTLPKAKTWIVLLLSLGFLALIVKDVARESPGNGMRRTEPIRQDLTQLRKILRSLERNYDLLHEVNESEQVVLMQSTLALLKDYLLPHLAAEEAVLYPAIEKQMQASRLLPTQAMREEHDIMRRWIKEMEALANAPLPDHNAFARRGERLLGLIEAHLDVVEAVLFPVLDQATPLSRGGGYE